MQVDGTLVFWSAPLVFGLIFIVGMVYLEDAGYSFTSTAWRACQLGYFAASLLLGIHALHKWGFIRQFRLMRPGRYFTGGGGLTTFFALAAVILAVTLFVWFCLLAAPFIYCGAAWSRVRLRDARRASGNGPDDYTVAAVDMARRTFANAREEGRFHCARLAAVPHFPELPRVRAGRDGETFLQESIRQHVKYKDAVAFAGKRVRALPPHAGRREIDLLVLTHKMLYVLEVKNWSGHLSVGAPGDGWRHWPQNRDPEPCKDLVTWNQHKTGVLMDYLARQGICLEPQFVAQHVVFINPNLTLEAAIADNPGVVTREELDRFLDRQPGASPIEPLLASLIEWLLEREVAAEVEARLWARMTNELYEAVGRTLASLSTWDELYLRGARRITGDLREIRTAAGGFARDELGCEQAFLDFGWDGNRNPLVSYAACRILGRPLGRLRLPAKNIEIPLTSWDTLVFHPAGERAPIEVPLMNLERIFIG